MTKEECLVILEKYNYRIGLDNTQSYRGKPRPEKERQELKLALNTLSRIEREERRRNKQQAAGTVEVIASETDLAKEKE